MIPVLLISLALVAGPADTPWEGWEPKDVLPTQALETLEEQAAPEPEPEPVFVPEPAQSGVEQWRGLVDSYPGWNTDVMLRVMRCESGGVPTAQNRRSTATGLFQIMWSIWYADQGPRSDLHDPYLNTQIAHQVWAMQGLGAWNASRSCWS